MISFRCIYCGQKIKAPDQTSGKKGKCPRCGHTIRVMNPSTKQTDAVNKLSDEDIAAMYLDSGPQKSAGLSPAWVGRAFIPTYNRLSLFIISIPMLMLLGLSGEFREVLIKVFKEDDPRLWILAAIMFVGMFFSVLHVFTRGPRPDYQKWPMLLFAVCVNGFSAIAAGLYMLRETPRSWLWIFPLWNLINGLMLLILLRFGQITTQDISDEDVTLSQALVAGSIAVGVFLLCNYVFKFYWAVTYSVCVVYATGFSRAVQQLLCPVARQIDKLD